MVMDVDSIVFDFWSKINCLWVFRGRNKRGDMELEEIVKIVFILIALVVIIGGIVFLLVGKGGNILESIKGIFSSGR